MTKKGKTELTRRLLRVAGILIAVIAIGSTGLLAACGGEEPTKTVTETVVQKTRIVVDMMGMTVEIPAEVKRVVTPYPIATNIIYTLQGQDKLVGIDDESRGNEWLQKIDPNVTDITTVGMPWSVNIETLLSLNPDVVIGVSGDVRTQVEDAGIPVIELNLGSGADLETAISLIGTVINKEDNARELVNYYEEQMALISARTSEIPSAERVRVLCIGRDNIYTAAIGGSYQDRMIESAGGINVAQHLTGQGWFAQVSIEQILYWNPEVILVPPYIWEGSVEAILNDPQWKDIEAVTDGRVYYIPEGVATWDTPVPESFLCPIWIAQLLYPDKFADVDIRETIKEFYSKFYNLSISDDDIDQILYIGG